VLDIRFMRANPDAVRRAARLKRLDFDVARLLEVDAERRQLLQTTEELKAQQNRTSKEIATLQGEERAQRIAGMQALVARLRELAEEQKRVEGEFEQRMLLAPNIPADEVPEGLDESQNVELRRWGEPRKFDFAPKDHVQLGLDLDLLDFERAAKLAGSIGTAEVPLTAYHAGEILAESDLPKLYAGLSPCFRREAGTYGKDTRGLYRIHQFQKVEQVVICRADAAESLRWHGMILQNSEELLQKLALPYRVVNVCGGDLGRPQVQKFDLETWMPSRGGYGETQSASRFHDFQARRLEMRYRDASGKVQFCHTLNNTVIASPRILIPILENYQQADGSVEIPAVLRPYMDGMEKLVPQQAG
jgi:seryl-tRNA synthetase